MSEKMPTDTEMLDWLQNHFDYLTGWAITDLGPMRVVKPRRDDGYKMFMSLRKAIVAAMKAERKP